MIEDDILNIRVGDKDGTRIGKVKLPDRACLVVKTLDGAPSESPFFMTAIVRSDMAFEAGALLFKGWGRGETWELV